MRRWAPVVLALAWLWNAPAFAAQPQTIHYQGYLTTSAGVPVNATVSMVFRLWDAAAAGTALWTETQPSVVVSNGVFQVALGSVTPIPLAFDAPYYLGVTVGADAEMAPRQALAASPYAFRAVPVQPRFVDNGDGTLTDKQGGLMWEKKLASGDSACSSGSQALRDVHCVQNTYSWSSANTDQSGTLFSDFLQQLNGLNTTGGTQCFAGFCDWRIPTIAELRSIAAPTYPNCTSMPCIDSAFGPTFSGFYYSSTSWAADVGYVWGVYFTDAYVGRVAKGNGVYGRAVRSIR